jgi:hypothetical protein
MCTHLWIEVFEDSFNVFVLANELHRSLGADASDGVAVVTPQQDTQVDELNSANVQIKFTTEEAATM